MNKREDQFVTENPKGGIIENSEWGSPKFAWKMKTWGGGGIAKVMECYLGDHFSEVTFKRGFS